MKVDDIAGGETFPSGPLIVAPVAMSTTAQATAGIAVKVVDMPIVGNVIAITIVCPKATLVVALDEAEATAFAIESTAAQLTHAQANDRSIVQ